MMCCNSEEYLSIQKPTNNSLIFNMAISSSLMAEGRAVLREQQINQALYKMTALPAGMMVQSYFFKPGFHVWDKFRGVAAV